MIMRKYNLDIIYYLYTLDKGPEDSGLAVCLLPSLSTVVLRDPCVSLGLFKDRFIEFS